MTDKTREVYFGHHAPYPVVYDDILGLATAINYHGQMSQAGSINEFSV